MKDLKVGNVCTSKISLPHTFQTQSGRLSGQLIAADKRIIKFELSIFKKKKNHLVVFARDQNLLLLVNQRS